MRDKAGFKKSITSKHFKEANLEQKKLANLEQKKYWNLGKKKENSGYRYTCE